MGNARVAALAALKSWRQRGAWSDAALHAEIQRQGLDARDAALASRICYGTIQNLIFLDHAIAQYCDRPVSKLEPQILDILRISAYQIMMMERIPNRAAVNEAVELCKCSGLKRAAGLVNAVLRRISDLNGALPNLPEQGSAAYLSVRYSHPLWLCEQWMNEHGYSFTEQALAANNAECPVCIQSNQLKADASRLYANLEAAGYSVAMHPHLPDAIDCFGGAVTDSEAFRSGWFYVQDAAAKSAVLIADPMPGMRILDACAAPGGKSFAAAVQMRDQGEIISCDIHENKLKRIREGAQRLGYASIRTHHMDAKHPDLTPKSFDVVIADAPCSGLGVIRKKPEIRFKSSDTFSGLPEIQLDILRGLAALVKDGGVLLYSTCTVQRAENEDVVFAFLRKHPNYSLEPFSLPWLDAPTGMHTFWPHIDGTDGFFTAKLRKTE